MEPFRKALDRNDDYARIPYPDDVIEKVTKPLAAVAKKMVAG